MHLLCLGDLHGEITLINRYYEDVTARFGLDIEAVLQCGDFGLYNDIGDFPAYIWGQRTLPCPVFAVFGNHESLPVIQALARRAITVPHLHLLGGEGMEHFVRHCDGYDQGDHIIQIMGVGGAYNAPHSNAWGTLPFDETVPRQHLTWWQQYRDTFSATERLTPAGYGWPSPVMEILIAHEAPSGFGALGDPVYGNPSDCGSASLGDLWRAVRPTIALSGHYHCRHSHRDPDGLRWEILPEAKRGAAVLDTETWQLTDIGPPT
jgi:hypothetical protein